MALVRLPSPYEPRDDLFLEKLFHQGSLEFPPGLPVRLARLRANCPLVLDAVTGRVPPEGRLPFELPRSMAAVRASEEDVPGTSDPLFAPGSGLALT